jgi:hypothetical protein
MANGFRINPSTYRIAAAQTAKSEIASDIKQLESQYAREMEEEQESAMLGNILKGLMGAGLAGSGLGPVSAFILGGLGSYGVDYALDELGAGGEIESLKAKYGRVEDMQQSYRDVIAETGKPDMSQSFVDSGISTLMSLLPFLSGKVPAGETRRAATMKDLFYQGMDSDRPFQSGGNSILQRLVQGYK